MVNLRRRNYQVGGVRKKLSFQLDRIKEEVVTLQKEVVSLPPKETPIPRILFLNHTQVKCGVYQFGKRVYELTARSKKLECFYRTVNDHTTYLNFIAETNPDYIIYNWHWDRMPWLKDKDITDNKKVKHYFIYHDGSMMKVYDKYLFFGAYDPKNKDAVGKRVLLPRPLFHYTGDYPVNDIPTIGSFGFAFSHKRFPELVTIVNQQYDEAILNIHITSPYFGDKPGHNIGEITQRCRDNNVKKGIQLNITQDFWDDEKLLTFLASNDINVFNYLNFDNPGLSSVMDYVLSVKRPIAITKNMMFRHMASNGMFLENNSIQSIIEKGTQNLEKYYRDWSVDSFTKSMENLFIPEDIKVIEKKNEVLFVNHKIPGCGVYQFGKRVYEQVASSKKVNYTYKEVDSTAELIEIFKNPPENIVFNWHRATMPLLTEQMVVNNQKSKHYFIWHEHVTRKNYYKYLFFGDYGLSKKDRSILLPRPLFAYSGDYPINKTFTIGSFGFGFWQKGFHLLVERANKEFKNAIINLHMAPAYFGDPDGSQTRAVIEKCRELNTNLKLNITQNFMTNEEVLKFLAGNDINAFLYSENAEGLSSATDYALSVNRPVMVTNCQMFRHFKNDDILAEKNTIMEVYNNGLKPLEGVRKKWVTEQLVKEMDDIFQ